MKRFFVCVLLFTAPLLGTIAQIDHKSAGSSNDNSVVTASMVTTAATLITVQVMSYEAAAEPAITESTGNISSFTACGAVQAVTGNTRIHGYYWVVTNPNQTSGTHTFTATQTGSFPTIFAQSWSGTHASAPLDQNNGTTGSSVMNVTLPTTTPTTANQLVITALGFSSDFLVSVDSPFTEQDEIIVTGNHYGGSMGYVIQTTATAASPTWSMSGTADLTATICTFKEAATSTSAAVPIFRRRHN